ncbi:MAG: glycerol-3-phosphate 1-O-acyltransferase PlsY [Candidatus Cloacimonetes bacterium]|nr:glycerol-3-phosphate 1-O-acyltransferase PlsY [Candidatus Cloacimonadota bacterium]
MNYLNSCNSFWACPLRMIAIAYLIGSIPFGWLMGKLFYKADIRQTGSGNIGATNALRSYGTVAGLIVLALDVGKGVAVAWLAKMVFVPGDVWIALAAGAAFLGHIFPVWLNFKGGKGIATAAGLFILLNPWALLVALLVFLSVVIISRYVSLGSVLAAAGLALFSIGQCILRALDIPLLILTLAVVAIVIIKHIPNLKRLKNKEENKISFSKKGSR